MFFSFPQTRYSWAEELNDIVYKEWQKKAAEHLKDMVSKAMAKLDDEIIDWLPTPLRNRLKILRQTEDFKKRSKQNSATSVLVLKRGPCIPQGLFQLKKLQGEW